MKSPIVHLPLPESYSLQRSLRLLSMGRHDPTMRLGDNRVRMSFATPEGATTLVADQVGDQLQVELHGTGAEWLQPQVEDCFGLNDNPSAFHPDDRVARLVAESPGIHLPRLPTVFHRLMQIVLQQLVSWEDAAAAWRNITRRFGEAAPGPSDLMTGATPAKLATLGYYDLVACGALPRQARLIIRLARDCRRIERLAAESAVRLEKYLQSIPGVGPWTIQYLMGTAMGHADAVLTGDYSLPHTVAWVLIQKPRSDDAEMLGLLQPYAGHRFRVQHLLLQSGITAPRRGPKMRRQRFF